MAVVKFAERARARDLLERGEPVPDDLRPAVAEITIRAAKRRWLSVVFALIAAAWMVAVVVGHPLTWQWLVGLGYVGMAAINFWQPQRTLRAARRQGLGPVTRYGWPC